jgi:hypothetical protein
MAKNTKKKGKQHVISKKTSVDGIQFRSKLEAVAYRELKRMNVPFEYEKKSYLLMEGFKPKVECWEHRYGTFRKRETKVQSITYTPDFTCPEGTWIMEVKGRANESFPLRWKMFRKEMEEALPEPVLFLVSCESDIKEAVKLINIMQHGNQE